LDEGYPIKKLFQYHLGGNQFLNLTFVKTCELLNNLVERCFCSPFLFDFIQWSCCRSIYVEL